MRGRILPLSIISALVYVVLFTFAFLPQLAILAIWQGRSAWANTIVLVLGEGLVIIQVRSAFHVDLYLPMFRYLFLEPQALFEGFFVDECRVDVFDVSAKPRVVAVPKTWC